MISPETWLTSEPLQKAKLSVSLLIVHIETQNVKVLRANQKNVMTLNPKPKTGKSCAFGAGTLALRTATGQVSDVAISWPMTSRLKSLRV